MLQDSDNIQHEISNLKQTIMSKMKQIEQSERKMDFASEEPQTKQEQKVKPLMSVS